METNNTYDSSPAVQIEKQEPDSDDYYSCPNIDFTRYDFFCSYLI